MKYSIKTPDVVNEAEDLAGAIHDLGLSPVASFLIESHHPVFTVLHSVFLCAKPFMQPFVSSSSLDSWELVFDNSSFRENLLSKLYQMQELSKRDVD